MQLIYILNQFFIHKRVLLEYALDHRHIASL